MRDVLPHKLEAARVQRPPYQSGEGDSFGLFEIRGPGRYRLRMLSSGARHEEEGAWEHVSVAVIGVRFCPTWEEMDFVKDLFWGQNECVIQFHPPEIEKVNNHKFTLHLWKAPYETPTPPSVTVGIKKAMVSR